MGTHITRSIPSLPGIVVTIIVPSDSIFITWFCISTIITIIGSYLSRGKNIKRLHSAVLQYYINKQDDFVEDLLRMHQSQPEDKPVLAWQLLAPFAPDQCLDACV